MSSIANLLKSRLADDSFNEVNLLNSTKLGEKQAESQEVVNELLQTHRENHQRNRNDLGLSITMEKIQELAPSLEHLDKRLQKHMQMLRQNECSLSGMNTVLEYDSAKSKADKLVEILKAKKTWSNVYEEIQLLEATDRDLRYQKLLELQKSFNILHKYAPKNSEREQNFERMKDEFLSWFSSATVLAIDTNDAKQIEALYEKYVALNRLPVFEQIFGSYAKNKIKCYLEESNKGERPTIWKVLQELFAIWKRCYSLSKIVVDEKGSKLIAENLLEGLTQKWDVMFSLMNEEIAAAETPFKAAREIGKVCSDFLSYVESNGDRLIYDVSSNICRRIFTVLGDDYSKHVTSVLLCAINKITIPEHGARGHYEWLLMHIDEIHSCMLGIIDEARTTFGAEFPQQIIPSFEKGVKELNSLLMNQNVFNIKTRRTEVKNVVDENMEEKISAICVTGSILNVIDQIDAHIDVCLSEYKNSHESSPSYIGNKGIIERLNRKVVARKIESIVNSIIQTMNAEMVKLKLSAASRPVNDTMKISLPSFSVAPHNYITNVGHELLSVMNTFSTYGTNRNFIVAIMSIAGKGYNEEEADLWVITEIGTRVMESFCDSIGNISQMDIELVRQFHADVVFLTEALIDLRLQPTTRFLDCASKLKKFLEEKEKK